VGEVGSHGDGGRHEGEGEVDGLGAVAAVRLALAHVGVVLLENGLVTLGLVLDVAAASDDPLVTSDVLVDLPADGVILVVGGAILEELLSLEFSDAALLLGLEPHGIRALSLSLRAALVAFESLGFDVERHGEEDCSYEED